jgi:diguanylate cyclase (GGDEF)-like protein
VSRRFWERPVLNSTAYTWAVVLIGAGALGVLSLATRWGDASWIITLFAAAATAHAIFLPAPFDGDHTLGPAVVAAALTVFGLPLAALAAAFGSLVGLVVVRRRPIVTGLFAAGQSVLATLLAAGAAFLIHFEMPSWIHAMYAGELSGGFTGGVAAAALAFVMASTVLMSGRMALERRTSLGAVQTGALAVGIANTLVLFALGTIVALVAMGALPSFALLLLLPVAILGAAVLIYAVNRQLVAELDVLASTAAELSRGLSTDEIAQCVAAAIDRTLPVDLLLIYLRAPGQQEPRAAHYRGPGGIELARQLEPEGFSSHVLRSGKPLRIADYDRDPRRSPRSEVVFGRGRVRSALVVPVATGTEVWGSIALARGTRGFFTARHERLIVSLAEQVAIAVRDLSLIEHARRQTDRIAALQHAGLLPGATLDPGEAGRQLAERAAEMLGARYACVALVDPQARELYGQAVHGADDGVFVRLRTRLDADGPELQEAARAVRERRPVVCDESQVKASACPSFRALPDVRSALTAPMLRQSRVVGALMVAYTEPHRVTETEMATLDAIATQGAVVIEHARRHVAVEAQVRQLEALLETTRRMGDAADVHTTFTVAAEGAKTVFGADRCLLLLWDGHSSGAQAFASGFSEEFVTSVRQHLQAIVGRHVVQAAHPVVIADFPGDPRMAPLRETTTTEGVRSGVFLPMRSQGEFIGTWLLAGLAGREGDGVAMPVAEAFTGQVAASIERVTLLARSQRRLDEQALLHRIIGSVSTSLELTEVFRAAASELSDALGAPRLSIYRVAGPVLRLAGQAGPVDVSPEVPATVGVKGRVVRTGRPEFLANVRDDPDYVAGNFDVTSLAVVPVLHDGAVTALLVAEGVAVRPISPQMFEFLIAFAQQLSITVRNAAFYEEQRRAHDELQVLYEAARAVSGTLDLRTVLDSMVSVTCRAFGYDNGAIIMVKPETGDMVVEAGYGYRHGIVSKRLPAGVGIAGWVARTGTPLVVDDVRGDARYYREDDRTQSELAVPLIAEGKVLGVFNVESARLAAFGARDLRLLTALASYAVVAIQNARLYETAQRMAITDGLTELYNHRHLYESLGRVIDRSRRDGQSVGLIMLEIDRFKRYNDVYGHQSGDEALRTVAGLLRRGSRPSDIVARYGGDEFMVVLPGVGKTAAQETAERLRRSVEAYPMILADEIITTVTLSVGVAAFPQDGDTVDDLVEVVDRAQYMAKRSGGNKVHVAHAP